MKMILCAILFFSSTALFGQSKANKIQLSSLPKTFKYCGKFKEGLTWSDKAGIHIVFISETGPLQPDRRCSGNMQMPYGKKI
jgi:hypothetical protein